MKRCQVEDGQVLCFLENLSESIDMGFSPYEAVLRTCEILSLSKTSVSSFFSFLYHHIKHTRMHGLSEAEVFRRIRLSVAHPTLNAIFEFLEQETRLGSDLSQVLREFIRETVVKCYDQIEYRIEKYAMQLLPPLFISGLVSTILLLGAAMKVVLGGI